MHRLVVLSLLFSTTSALAQPAPDPTPPPPPPLVARPGGYLQADSRLFPDDSGTHELTIRRLRFKLDGTAARYVNFRTLIDVAGSKLVVDDAWAELALRPELALRFGKDKAQFGLERLQSAAQLAFIERGYPTQLAPNRDLGLAARGDVAQGLVHYSLAVVAGVADNAVLESETDSKLEYNAHLLISPFKATHRKGHDLAIGAAATFGRTAGTLAATGLTPIKSAGQATIVKFAGAATDDLANTARTDGYRHRETVHGYYFGGPVGVLAEYVRDSEPVVLRRHHTLVTSTAWQVAATVAVTPGDHPAYKGLKPARRFDPEHGSWGALELAARYAALRIDDDAFTAGITNADSSVRRVRAITLGVNWYLSEYVKLQLDYERASFTAGAPGANWPTENVIATRFQVAI